MKTMTAVELARYWQFEPVTQTRNKTFYVNQFFGEPGAIYTRFGWRGHNGLDIKAQYVNCYAVFGGTVLNYRDEKDNKNARGDFLNIVSKEKKIGNQWIRLRAHYFHLRDVYVKETNGWGKGTVEAGEKVGKTGNTGKLSDGTLLSTGPHLHFGIYPQYFNSNGDRWEEDKHNGYNGAVDPIYFFRARDVRNYPDIKQDSMKRLIKSANAPDIYLLGDDNQRYRVDNMKQLEVWHRMGVVVNVSQVEEMLDAQIEDYPLGNPIYIGLKDE
jgi:murein DD-endopeptidase MepM/ murein hydrolase activator NlpD|tara:strand:+ start:2120 stop:2929 length:810 start_codon:yes stop_codon:yes gene_type:complete